MRRLISSVKAFASAGENFFADFQGQGSIFCHDHATDGVGESCIWRCG
jgi:uncharacterized protein (AIM24 family)